MYIPTVPPHLVNFPRAKTLAWVGIMGSFGVCIFWVGDFLIISNKQLNFSLFVTRVEDVEDIYQREFPEFRIFVNSITIGIPHL